MTLLSKIAAKLRIFIIFFLFASILVPLGAPSSFAMQLTPEPSGTLQYHTLSANTDNPILTPIFNFFKSIWTGLSNMWGNFTSAIGNWFNQVFSYTYAGMPVGPLLLIVILIAGFFMIWGFFKLVQWTRTD